MLHSIVKYTEMKRNEQKKNVENLIKYSKCLNVKAKVNASLIKIKYTHT